MKVIPKSQWPDYKKSGTTITKEIINSIATSYGTDVVVFRNNVGTWNDGRSFVRYGLAPGSPDIVCILRGSIFVGIEIKSLNDKESEAQKNWSIMCQRLGIHHIVAKGSDRQSACDIAMDNIRGLLSGGVLK